jgi:sec-independent protein translocase protein TatA
MIGILRIRGTNNAHSVDINKHLINMNRLTAAIVLILSVFGNVSAFAPATSKFGVPSTQVAPQTFYQPAALQRQRQSVAQVQTMGLFGLGAPEVGIILIAAAFLLGPEKLAEFGKDAGKIAGELKEVPKEFQKGLDEGEAQAKITRSKSESPEVIKEAVKEEKSE